MKKSKSTILGINANIITAVAYIGGLILMWIPTICYFAWIIPFLIYLIETENKFIKNHASQGIFVYLGTSIISIGVYIFLKLFSVPIDFNQIYNILASGSLIIILLISLSVSILKIVVSFYICIATIKSWNYEEYDIPYIKKYLKKFRKFLLKLEKNGDKSINYKDNTPKNNTSNNPPTKKDEIFKSSKKYHKRKLNIKSIYINNKK